MRIAVPTNDGASISEHFGRSASFLIFEIENGQIKSRELRTNGAKHSHAQGRAITIPPITSHTAMPEFSPLWTAVKW